MFIDLDSQLLVSRYLVQVTLGTNGTTSIYGFAVIRPSDRRASQRLVRPPLATSDSKNKYRCINTDKCRYIDAPEIDKKDSVNAVT